MKKLVILLLVLAASGTLLLAEGSAAILKPHPAEPLPAAGPAADAAAGAPSEGATAVKAAKAPRKADAPAPRALHARGRILRLEAEGRSSAYERVVLKLKDGRRLSIDVAKAMVASHRLRAGEDVSIAYKVERGRKVATRVQS